MERRLQRGRAGSRMDDLRAATAQTIGVVGTSSSSAQFRSGVSLSGASEKDHEHQAMCD